MGSTAHVEAVILVCGPKKSPVTETYPETLALKNSARYPDPNFIKLRMSKENHLQSLTFRDRVSDQTAIDTLLDTANIADWALLVRSTIHGAEEAVVYFVPRGPVNTGEMAKRLRVALGEAIKDARMVPLFKLPLTKDGLMDRDQLEAIAVKDDDLLADVEAQLETLTGSRRVAAVRVLDLPSHPPRHHLADVLPLTTAARGARQQPILPREPRLATSPSLQPAMVEGTAIAELIPRTPDTLLDVLERVARDMTAGTIRFVSGNGELVTWSYDELWSRAERVYGGLTLAGLRPGDKVVLLLLSNTDILATFWACQMGGYVPVIVEVPVNFNAGNQAFERAIGLFRILGTPFVAADAPVVSRFSSSVSPIPLDKIRFLSIQELNDSTPNRKRHKSAPDDIALLNLSSGSTGTPKCVMLSHRNLLTRAAGANHIACYSKNDVILNWLPFDHIGSISDWHIRCVLLGCDLVYVDKDYVLGQPENWLSLMDRFRVTHSWAPNFAYALISKNPEHYRSQSWDLSCVKGLLTAGEAVSRQSTEAFIRSLARFGLKQTAIQPAFGMAELGSGITYFVPTDDSPLRFHTVITPSVGDAVTRVSEDHPGATTFADLGPPIPGVALRIVDEEGNLQPIETVGRLQVRGDVLFAGYFGSPSATSQALQTDGWFTTGDLGFLTQGHLVLTGREKETVIIKGANYYSHEIEEAVNQIDGVSASFTAACGVRCARDDEEKLAIFFAKETSGIGEDLVRSIRTLVANHFGVNPSYLIPMERNQIPKTAIGKIQRTQLKERLESGALDSLVRRVDLILENQYTLPAWFYRTTWIRKELQNRTSTQTRDTSLIVGDNLGLADALAEKLQAMGRSCVLVDAGREFAGTAPFRFSLNPVCKADWEELFRTLSRHHRKLDEIIVLVDYDRSCDPSLNQDGIFPDSHPNVAVFLNIVQAASAAGMTDRLRRFLWVSNDCQSVESTDAGSPQKAMISGFTKSLRREFPSIDSAHVDLELAYHDSNAERVLLETYAPSDEASVAYRQKHRYVARIRDLDLISEAATPISMRTGGLYLVTGGLGGIGFELCRILGRTYRARLLIVGRAPVEPCEGSRCDFESPASIRHRSLREEGIDCIYARIDVADQKALLDQLDRAEAAFGRRLDGVFHAAGSAHETPLLQETVEGFARVARAKLQGTRALGELIKTRPGCFLLGFSSVNALLGGMNTASYTAANAYMEAYCRGLYRTDLPALCYSWSLWDGIGMSSNSAVTKSAAAAKGLYPIPMEEGLHSLLAALHSGQSEAIIGLDSTTAPIQTLLANDRFSQQTIVGFVERDAAYAGEPIARVLSVHDRFGTPIECPIVPLAAFPLTNAGTPDRNQIASLAAGRGPREEPANETESTLVDIWRDVLQVADVGTHDNFFELGGDSLLAVQLVTRIDAVFKVRLAVSAVFHAPTIQQMAHAFVNVDCRSKWFSVVPIRASGSAKPLFIVQSVGQDLIQHLDPDKPVYAFNYGVGAENPEEMLNLPSRLEDLASHYIDEMLSIQSIGPYSIIGHSAAGLVAYEMARQLTSRGHSMDLLALIDTHYLPDNARSSGRFRQDMLTSLLTSPATQLARISENWIRHRIRNINYRYFSKRTEIPIAIRARHLFNKYVPKSYNGTLTYIKCTRHSRFEPVRNDEAQWKELAPGGIEVHTIPCHHYEIMKNPYVRMLARIIMQSTE